MADSTMVDKQTDEADLPAVLRQRFGLAVEPRLYAAKRNRAKPVLGADLQH